MNHDRRKYHSQIEITDLVGQGNSILDSEEILSSLSDRQAKKVSGGNIVLLLQIIAGGYAPARIDIY
ncbi:hypothetical protein NIES2119_00670 [[Phormidium ambiguum] IAM M-71]|uniref:Uncharacterized protein n=1 Tax=[Phormidium ambiguum] IAM M-71 TaxID=454136 RepID=A0A1U7ITL2_9CYAN|nr:hypothetical protein [Phormidium ambiguum]OKH40860.1 hypothetical protein NIES2119_00670 [Phormidium ambiguum IAM M-71]